MRKSYPYVKYLRVHQFFNNCVDYTSKSIQTFYVNLNIEWVSYIYSNMQHEFKTMTCDKFCHTQYHMTFLVTCNVIWHVTCDVIWHVRCEVIWHVTCDFISHVTCKLYVFRIEWPLSLQLYKVHQFRHTQYLMTCNM